MKTKNKPCFTKSDMDSLVNDILSEVLRFIDDRLSNYHDTDEKTKRQLTFIMLDTLSSLFMKELRYSDANLLFSAYNSNIRYWSKVVERMLSDGCVEVSRDGVIDLIESGVELFRISKLAGESKLKTDEDARQ